MRWGIPRVKKKSIAILGSIGSTVKFVSRNSYRLLATGRINHFISVFDEQVIGEVVEKAMQLTCGKFPEVEIVEFTVAPQVTPGEGLPYHEWFIEFSNPPQNIERFTEVLDDQLRDLNVYYDDLISGSILRKLVVTQVRRNAFIDFMKSQGKLGGQNKVPRLANDRTIAIEMNKYV